MKNNKPLIVGIGELLWDIFPDRKKAGGAPINFVYHTTQMGAEGCAISAVGDDALGAEILRELEKNNICSCIEKVDYPTGSVLVKLNNGLPSYSIIEGVAWDYIPLTEQAINLVKDADAVCFGTLAQRSSVSHKTIKTLLKHTPENAIRFFDINLRQHYHSKELIEESLLEANIFKLNDEELEAIRSMFGLEVGDDEICSLFIEKYNLRYLVLTAGGNSSTIYSQNEKSVIPTPKVVIADTVGAGDSFSGAFVFSILSGKSLSEAHREAVDIAAFVCTQHGAWPPYPEIDAGR